MLLQPHNASAKFQTSCTTGFDVDLHAIMFSAWLLTLFQENFRFFLSLKALEKSWESFFSICSSEFLWKILTKIQANFCEFKMLFESAQNLSFVEQTLAWLNQLQENELFCKYMIKQMS